MARASTDNPVTAAYRWQVASRVLAAFVGGYLLANTGAILLAGVLPMARSDAVQVAMMCSFLLYLGAWLWVFATRSALRAWLGLLLPALLCLGAAALLGLPGLAWLGLS